MATTNTTTTLSMKLLINRKAQRLLFAEVSKDVVDFTTGFSPFAEREGTLAERMFPLGEAFTESFLSVIASRCHSTGEEVFAESMRGPSRQTCAERPTKLSAKGFSKNKKKHGRPAAPPP
jgi:purine nucleoside phosphorylase